MSRRSAPRRKIVGRYKTGDYATSLWHHELECGHIEVRKRKAQADQIGCVRCEASATIAETAPLPEDVPVVDLVATVDTEAAVLRARLAGILDLPIDAITVEVSMNRIAGALVFLDPTQITDILRRST